MLRYMPIGSHKGAEGSSCIFQWFIMVITMVMKLITRNGKEWMRRQTRVGIIIKWSERSEHGSSNTGANKADRADRANPTGQYWFDDTMGSGLNEGYHEWHSWGFGGIGIPIGTGIGFNLHILILILVLGAAMAWQYNAAWMKGITSGACVQPEQWPVTIHRGSGLGVVLHGQMCVWMWWCSEQVYACNGVVYSSTCGLRSGFGSCVVN